MTQEIISKIKHNIKTKEERDSILTALDLLKDSVYKLKGNTFEKTLDKSLSYEISNYIKELIRSRGISISDKRQVISLLEELSQAIKDFSELKLTIAFTPTTKTIKKISRWVKKNISENVILDIEQNSQILGGAQFKYFGKYIDLSLEKQLEKTMKKNKKEIINTLV